MTKKITHIRSTFEHTALKIIDEKNDRIRKLEIVILTLAEADEISKGGNLYSGTRKKSSSFLQRKMWLEQRRNTCLSLN